MTQETGPWGRIGRKSIRKQWMARWRWSVLSSPSHNTSPKLGPLMLRARWAYCHAAVWARPRTSSSIMCPRSIHLVAHFRDKVEFDPNNVKGRRGHYGSGTNGRSFGSCSRTPRP